MEIRKINIKEIKQISLIGYSPEYISFCKKFWRADPVFLGIFENNEIAAVIPMFFLKDNGLKYISSGVKFYNEIFYFKDIKIDFDALINFIKKNLSFDILEFSFCQIIDEKNFTNNNFNANTSAYVLDVGGLKNSDELLANLNKKTRNQIRVSEKNNLDFTLGQDIESFYPVYIETMTRLKAIPKEKKYFSDLLLSFGEKLSIILAKKDGKIIGGNLYIIYENYLILMFNASLKKYWNMNINNLLYWQMIKFGLKKGIRWFDFGINARRDCDQIHFKEGFGAKAYPINHLLIINSCRAFFYVYIKKFLFLVKLIFKKI